MASKVKNSAFVGASKTVDQFCEIENLSRFSYYKMRRNGYGPEELRIPGMDLVRITAKAHADWRARMLQLALTEEAKIESARRLEQRIAAGKNAARANAKKKRVA